MSFHPIQPFSSADWQGNQRSIVLSNSFPGHLGTCLHCNGINSLGHDEVCRKRFQTYTVRHESIKVTLAHYLRTIPNTAVRVEGYTDLRNGEDPPDHDLPTDLTITGPASFQHISTDYDLTLSALATQDYAAPPRIDPGIECPKRAVLSAIKKFLDHHAARKIASTLEERGSPSTRSFNLRRRFVQSNKGHFRVLAFAPPWPTYRSLMINIGVGLVRSRARTFVL